MKLSDRAKAALRAIAAEIAECDAAMARVEASDSDPIVRAEALEDLREIRESLTSRADDLLDGNEARSPVELLEFLRQIRPKFVLLLHTRAALFEPEEFSFAVEICGILDAVIDELEAVTSADQINEAAVNRLIEQLETAIAPAGKHKCDA